MYNYVQTRQDIEKSKSLFKLTCIPGDFRSESEEQLLEEFFEVCFILKVKLVSSVKIR